MPAQSINPTSPSIQTRPSVNVSDITIQLQPDSRKSIKLIDVNFAGENVEGQWEGEDKTHRLILSPPFPLTSSQTLNFSLRYKTALPWRKSEEATISDEATLTDLPVQEAGRREWHRTYGKIKLSVGLTFTERPAAEGLIDNDTGDPDLGQDTSNGLRPTTENILRICPRFRILVIGKTGVGKSSLINKAFGVNDAAVAHDQPGQADIDREIYSQQNGQFVLHDSKGFEHGEEDNVNIVQNFITARNNMPDIKDKLHAVWLCFDIPTAGGRLLETGVEDFLKMKVEGQLGGVPVIGVFTKYDLLVNKEELAIYRSSQADLSQEAITKLARKAADTNVLTDCVEPFKEHTKGKVPHITVSTDPKYEETLRQLIKFTYDNVFKYVEEASIVSAIAQRVSPDVNIDASIAVGKKKYWRGLASSTQFPGYTLKDCLAVIHADIVKIWSFKDPNEFLNSEKFKAMMTNTIDISENARSNTIFKGGLGLVASLAGILGGLSGPAAPIVLPIVAGLVLAAWVHQVYKQTHATLRRLMTYIVDLILVMQIIFRLQAALKIEDLPLSRRLIKLAFRTHYQSGTFEQLHRDIRAHADGTVGNFGRDQTFEKIVSLINSNRIESDTTSEWEHNLVGRFDPTAPDEPWGDRGGDSE